MASKDDGSYQSDVVVFASSNMWEDQEERGTYAISGSTLTATPNQWSCPGPDPVAVASFSLAGGNLVVANASGEIVYPPRTDTRGSGGPTNGVTITIGLLRSELHANATGTRRKLSLCVPRFPALKGG